MILRIVLPVIIRDEHEEEVERAENLGIKAPEPDDKVKIDCENRVFYTIDWIAQDPKYENCSLVSSGGYVYKVCLGINDLDAEICLQLGIETIEPETQN